MEFTTKKNGSCRSLRQTVVSSSPSYNCAFSFYDTPPSHDNISLEEFELLAIERLQILRTLEKISSLSGVKYSGEWRENVEKELKKLGLEYYTQISDIHRNAQEHRRRDIYSHFILRLAFCRTDELRKRFLTGESDFFRFRFGVSSDEEIQNMIQMNDLSFFPISEEERSLLGEKLLFSTQFNVNGPSIQYYKVHFTEALDLIRSRKVFLMGGFAYIPNTELITILQSMFKTLLQQNLLHTTKILPNLEDDERLLKMLSHLDKRYTGSDYSSTEKAVKAEMILPLSEKSFPLCMRAIQRTLSTTHHIKYKARLQYGLFLKGIGLSLEEAIRFFRSEFKNVDSDKFDKEYIYGIRYNYGQEGKKVNWTPWNCMKIIMDNVSSGDSHGCPFRHFDSKHLSTFLPEASSEINSATKEGHYTRACALHFKALHGFDLSTGIVNHPNQFYQESNNTSSDNKSQNKLITETVVVY